MMKKYHWITTTNDKKCFNKMRNYYRHQIVCKVRKDQDDNKDKDRDRSQDEDDDEDSLQDRNDNNMGNLRSPQPLIT